MGYVLSMENLDAWLIYLGIPVACGLFWLISEYESPWKRRRLRKWRREIDRRIDLSGRMKAEQELRYLKAFRAETSRHFGGPCPHPKKLIDAGGKCHGCLTSDHSTLSDRLVALVMIILFLAFVWAIMVGPWSDEFWNPPGPECSPRHDCYDFRQPPLF